MCDDCESSVGVCESTVNSCSEKKEAFPWMTSASILLYAGMIAFNGWFGHISNGELYICIGLLLVVNVLADRLPKRN